MDNFAVIQASRSSGRGGESKSLAVPRSVTGHDFIIKSSFFAIIPGSVLLRSPEHR